MRKRSYPQNTARRITTANDVAVSWRTVFLIVVCVAILAAGFFFAARQHFSAMEFGINNSRLRKQIEELQAENRRLTLAREVVMSPSEVTKLARVRGFENRTENTVSVAMPVKNVAVASQLVKTTISETAKPAVADLPKVKSTVISKPVKNVETAKKSRSRIDGDLIARVRQVPE